MKRYCISHRKDVDGLGAGALVKAATGAEVILADYDDLLEKLRKIPDDAGLVLCDLGTDNAESEDFVKEMRRIAKKGSATYIDHHFMSAVTSKRLTGAGVKVVHDPRDCASMLVYRTFKDDLPEQARFVALCGAVTDYMDDSPTSQRLMEQADRQFVLLEASMLSYALGHLASEDGFAERVVDDLALWKLPHQMKGVPAAAVDQLAEVTRLEGIVKKEGTKLGRLAYMKTTKY